MIANNMSTVFLKKIIFLLFKLQKLIKKWEKTVKLMNLLMIMAGNYIMNKYIINQKIYYDM